MHTFPNLLRSIKFGSNLVAPNRMYFSSVGFDLCNQEGRPLPEFFEVYESILDGGCGFGFLGNASVDPNSQYTDRSLKLVSKSHATDVEPIINTARGKGIPLGIQLQHYGEESTRSANSTKFRSTVLVNTALQTVVPRVDVTSLSEEQIEAYINHFHTAACLAMEINAPAVQIHAANGYLLSSFLSPRTNHRTDRWGGTAINRARILLETLRRIRTSALDRMAIFVRLQVDDGFGAEGLHVELLDDVIAAVEAAGADAITCATGVAETFGKFLGDSEYTMALTRHAARFLKRKTNIPIGFAANIGSLSTAEEILASGDADFIGFGRTVIADHQFVLKELSDRSTEVNRCRWDSFCLRDKKEPLADRVYCCVNPMYLRPKHIQDIYQGNKS